MKDTDEAATVGALGPPTGRASFIGRIPSDRTALEIGPFNAPVLKGSNVRYADVLSTDDLRQRAVEIGRDLETVPDIDFVIPNGDLSTIDDRFGLGGDGMARARFGTRG